MAALEAIRHTFQRMTGFRKPARRDVEVRQRKAWATMFRDDGEIPNNPLLPFIHYCSVVPLTKADDPAAVLEQLFADNEWSGAWRNGIYDFVHYHPRIHEVLGVACGRARVRFGGRHGKIV